MVARGEACATPGTRGVANLHEPRRGDRGSVAPPGLIISLAARFQGFAEPHPWLPSVAPPGLQNSSCDNIE